MDSAEPPARPTRQRRFQGRPHYAPVGVHGEGCRHRGRLARGRIAWRGRSSRCNARPTRQLGELVPEPSFYALMAAALDIGPTTTCSTSPAGQECSPTTRGRRGSPASISASPRSSSPGSGSMTGSPPGPRRWSRDARSLPWEDALLGMTSMDAWASCSSPTLARPVGDAPRPRPGGPWSSVGTRPETSNRHVRASSTRASGPDRARVRRIFEEAGLTQVTSRTADRGDMRSSASRASRVDESRWFGRSPPPVRAARDILAGDGVAPPRTP
jgi:hypothetical protein